MKIQHLIVPLLLMHSLSTPITVACEEVGAPVNITEEMLFTDDPKDWMKPKRVSVPAYPKQLLEQGITGHVDVRVTVDELGAVLKTAVLKSTPPQPELERSAVESIQFWTMTPVLTDQCVPIIAEGTIRIWYDIKDGKPSISISTKHGTYAKVNSQAVKAKLINESAVRASAKYPMIGRKEGLNALVYVVASIEAATGIPVKVSASFVKTTQDSGKTAFAYAAEKALSAARLQPLPDYPKKHYSVCMPFQFRIAE